MGLKIGEQIERRLSHGIVTEWGRYPWRQVRKSQAWSKTRKHRRERRRAKGDIECPSEYRRYYGYEW